MLRDPRNVQFRFVVGEGSALTNKGVSSKISVDDASRKLDGEFGFVGFVELYRESLCLLGWRATKQVPSYCRCGAEGAALRREISRPLRPHTAEAYDSSLDKVPPSIQASLKKLVEKDELFYLTASTSSSNRCERRARSSCVARRWSGCGVVLWRDAAAGPSTSQYIREHYNKSCPWPVVHKVPVDGHHHRVHSNIGTPKV